MIRWRISVRTILQYCLEETTVSTGRNFCFMLVELLFRLEETFVSCWWNFYFDWKKLLFSAGETFVYSAWNRFIDWIKGRKLQELPCQKREVRWWDMRSLACRRGFSRLSALGVRRTCECSFRQNFWLSRKIRKMVPTIQTAPKSSFRLVSKVCWLTAS